MSHLVFGMAHSSARPKVIQTWYYPGIDWSYGRAAQRIGRFPPLPAAAAPTRGGRPAGDAPAPHARAAPRGSGGARRHRRRLVRAGWTGRATSIRRCDVDALARALKLGKREHRHLRALARHGDQRAFATETVPEAGHAGGREPAASGLRRWPALGRGGLEQGGREIFGWGRMPEDERNTLLCMLTNPVTRRLFGSSWADEARRMVAQFRKTHDLWAGDPAFVDLLDRLRTAARSSPAGGRRTTSATARPASRRWCIRRRGAALPARVVPVQRRSRAEAGDLHAGLDSSDRGPRA